MVEILQGLRFEPPSEKSAATMDWIKNYDQGAGLCLSRHWQVDDGLPGSTCRIYVTIYLVPDILMCLFGLTSLDPR